MNSDGETSPGSAAAEPKEGASADRADRRRLQLHSKGGFLLAAAGVLVLDQWSKWVVEAHLPEHASQVVVPGFLDFTHVRNTGVAFGLLAGAGHVVPALALAGVGLVALLVVATYFWRTPVSEPTLLWALSLVLGGAVGNLLDRFASGAVTDFVDFSLGTHHWPAFNVADGAITIGLLVLAYSMLSSPRAEPAD